jgi:hypothetical protein
MSLLDKIILFLAMSERKKVQITNVFTNLKYFVLWNSDIEQFELISHEGDITETLRNTRLLTEISNHLMSLKKRIIVIIMDHSLEKLMMKNLLKVLV